MNSRNPTEKFNEAAKNSNEKPHQQNGLCCRQDVKDGKQNKGIGSFSKEQ